MKVNRFGEVIDEEEINNIFIDFIDNGYKLNITKGSGLSPVHRTHITSPISDYRILISKDPDDFIIMGKSYTSDKGLSLEKLESNEALYSMIIESISRLSDRYKITEFAINDSFSFFSQHTFDTKPKLLISIGIKI